MIPHSTFCAGKWKLALLAGTIVIGISLFGVRELAAQEPDSALVARFQLAEAYARSAQFQRAVTILEDLYTDSPETHVFYDRLKSAYENLKRYDDAIVLVESRIALGVNVALYRSEKARLIYLRGDETEALRVWQEAIATNPVSPGIYILVYRSLMQVRLFEFATEVLEQGRTKLENENLFQVDLAYLYSITSRHGEAVAEYVRLLEGNPDQLAFVRSRLDQFIHEEGALDESISIAEEAVGQSPLSRPNRELLAFLYVEADRFNDALQVYRAVDLLEEEHGSVLFSFARVAADAAAYDVASEAFTDILRRYPEAPSAPDALRGLGIMQEQWALSLSEASFDSTGSRITDTLNDRALSTYTRFLQSYPTHVYYPDVLGRIARIHQFVFFDLAAAEISLREVMMRYPGTIAADLAAFDMGRLLLQKNDLVNARIQFSRLVSRRRTGDLADRARYQLSLLHFYRGDFDSALSLSSAMQENTSADVANDAIELTLLLSENRGPDSLDVPLTGYARAMLHRRQRDPVSASIELERIQEQFPGHSLSDEILFARAEIFQDEYRWNDALETYLRLPESHPTSFLADISLFRAASLLADKLNDPDGAILIYSRLLQDHPKSLLVQETRQQIRSLRGDEV